MMNQPRGSINKKNIIKKAVLLSMGGALLMPISSGAEEVYSLPEMVVTAEKMPVESKKDRRWSRSSIRRKSKALAR